MHDMKRIVGVIGGRQVRDSLLEEAEEVGRLLAERDAIVVCGGLEGVMEAVARGAKQAGGLTVGILPQDSRVCANPYIDIPIATGMGIGRNVIIARTADLFIAIGGEYGTLSEIAFALQIQKPVIGIQTWDIKGIIQAKTAKEAVELAFQLLQSTDIA
jgi:hypothetical protein